MTLEDLKKLEQEANALTGNYTRHEKAADALKNLRTGPHELLEILTKVLSNWSYGSDELARGALHQVVNEMKTDILRLAELRMTAKARELKISSTQRRAVLNAAILPIPGFEAQP